MSTVPAYWNQATAALCERDAVLRKVITRLPGLTLVPRVDPFMALARSIVGQQISVRAAQTIWDRLAARLDGVSPELVLGARRPTLRACGLSGQKADYLKDLARKFADGDLDASGWHALDDEMLIVELTRVKGIGRWTAEMFLMFHLVRPDVLPLADIGLQRAMRLHYNGGRPLSVARMRKLGAAWAPWRSVATWYLWRSLEAVPIGTASGGPDEAAQVKRPR
jgi:DNA-3-methyladenine glycosylase II